MDVTKKVDWTGVWDCAIAGDLQRIPANVRVQHYRTIRTIRADFAKPVALEREIHVYWGRTGSGKSRQAWEQSGLDAYPKDPRTKFWDGYNGHEHVVIDEFRGGIDISHVLRWFDRYPVLVEIKGSSMPLVATKIWITSNISPREWYPGLDEETLNALLRRLNILHFDYL
nr:MAG: replication polyprotein [Chemarfal virus 185]